MCSASFFIEINMYSKRNVKPKKEIKEIQSKLTEKYYSRKFVHYMKAQRSVIAEKGLGHFLTALKASKSQKELHHCLTTVKVFNTEKKAPSLPYDFYSY